MRDRREEIMARLVAIAEAFAEGMGGGATVMRNEPLAEDTVLPAIQILDADEAADDRDHQPGGRAMPPSTARVGMTPEIYITLADMPENVGTVINILRRRFIRAILTDATLRQITGPNGSIRFNACATGLSRGREMMADMGVSFTFTYPLIVAELAD